MSDAPPERSVHRALADDRRARIVAELREAPAGLDAYELAARLGLHANTVRWHLAILADAQLVSSHAAGRTTPGRPRIVYTLGQGTGEGESYRLLATILHGALGRAADGFARAEEAGRAWGRYLVDRPRPGSRTSREAAVGEVVGLLAHHGFRPEVEGDEIRMHRCPFRDLAQLDPPTVCAVHQGLLSGALEELESGVEVESLEAFVRPDLCVARLRSRA